MKKSNLILAMVIAFVGLISLNSCKPKDSDIKMAVEKAMQSNPDMAAMAVSVEKGVVTISGECKDEVCKASCQSIISAIKGVKSVVNNCTITPPPAPL